MVSLNFSVLRALSRNSKVGQSCTAFVGFSLQLKTMKRRASECEQFNADGDNNDNIIRSQGNG